MFGPRVTSPSSFIGGVRWLPHRARAGVRCLAALAAVAGHVLVSRLAVAQVPSHDRVDSLGAADYTWRLTRLDGREVALSDFRGRVLVINYWATWCRPCVVELPTLEALRDSLAADGIEVIAVSPEAPRPVRRFVERNGVGLPAYLEAEPLPVAFGRAGLPTTYIVDRRGRIVLRRYGAADWSIPEVRAFLRRLAEEPVAIGASSEP